MTVKKKDRYEEHNPYRGTGRIVLRDWQPLFARLREAIDWALDIAVRLAEDYHEDIATIERVRGYAHGWLDGRPVEVDMDDVLTTLGILFAAIELDVGIDSSTFLDPLRTLPTVIHLPGAAHDDLATVVTRRPVKRRKARFARVQLAA